MQSRSNRSNSTSDEVAPTFDLVKLYSEPRRPIHARSEADLLIEKDTQQQMICQRTVSDWMISSEIRLGSSLFFKIKIFDVAKVICSCFSSHGFSFSYT